MLNKIILQGRICNDPELKTTQSGISTCGIRLAVERDFKSGQKVTDFFSVTCWRATAEFVSRYFSKGRMAIVDGRLQNREYTTRDGDKRQVTEIQADAVYFGDSRRDADTGYTAVPTSHPSQKFEDLTEDDGELPF